MRLGIHGPPARSRRGPPPTWHPCREGKAARSLREDLLVQASGAAGGSALCGAPQGAQRTAASGVGNIRPKPGARASDLETTSACCSGFDSVPELHSGAAREATGSI